MSGQTEMANDARANSVFLRQIKATAGELNFVRKRGRE